MTSELIDRASAWLDRAREIGIELAAIDVTGEASPSLLETVRQRATELGRGMVRCAMALAGSVSNAQYMALLLLRSHPDPRALLTRLLGGERRTVSTQQLDDLASLAIQLGYEEASASFTASITPDHRDPSFWKRHLSSGAWARIESWLDRFGHRGPFESDIASPRYGEDLRVFARALFPLVRTLGEGLATRGPSDRADVARQALRDVETRGGPRHRRRVEKRVSELRGLLELRERVRNEAVRVSYPLRRMGLELGRRLTEAGRLPDPTDVWHLSLDELGRGITDTGYPLEVAAARERNRRAAWERVTVPNRFSSDQPPTFPGLGAASGEVELSRPFKGNGVSPGLVEGVARVIHSPVLGTW